MRVKGLLPSPAFFHRDRPKITCTAPNNPSRPASFLRQFSPQHSPVARPFCGKRGLFAPNTRRTRPLRPPKRLFLPRRGPVFARRARKKPRLATRFARAPGTRAHLWDPWNARVCGFCARQRPFFCRPLPSARRTPRWKPRLRRNPARQARRPARCRRPPPRVSPPAPPRHSLWARQPRLPWSAFPLRRGEVYDPKGGSDPWA